MAWDQLEPTGPHLAYLSLSLFLIVYALFSIFVRDRLHLSEPPLATVFGILFGPKVFNILEPRQWGVDDRFKQEFTRVIVGIQCFAIGLELPNTYFKKHWSSIAMLLGPVMAGGWVVCTLLIHWLLEVDLPTASVLGACLTPTDPVLAASVLSSKFSTRVPTRIKHMLSAESGSNDGISFPFLYVGLSILTKATSLGAFKKWALIVVLYQCVFGIILGVSIGYIANRLLRFSDSRQLISRDTFLVYYLLLALFCIGAASTLGADDFLVAFSAGLIFSHDGLFTSRTAKTQLPNVIDLLLNSSLFIYFGAIIPWDQFTNVSGLSVGRLFGLLALVLVLRRLPFVLALKPLVKDIHTWREALFAGHFGPMGVGALFLAMEARAQLENDSSEPDPKVPNDLPPVRQRAVELVWPVICFIVFGSIIVHGSSTLAISVWSHFARPEGERAPLIGAETGPFYGMVHEESGEEDENDED